MRIVFATPIVEPLSWGDAAGICGLGEVLAEAMHWI
jgi:hypothetical protein